MGGRITSEYAEDLERTISSPKSIGNSLFKVSCKKLQDESKSALKTEWERVKTGEKTFRYLRNLSFGVVVVAGMGFLFKLYG
jgi:hypothetical protein